MEKWLAVVLGTSVVVAAGQAPASDSHVSGDPQPGVKIMSFGDACTDNLACVEHPLAAGFMADGEWNPVTQLVGFVTTGNTVVVTDGLCAVQGETAITGPDFPGPVTRSFAWGNQAGDSWVGSWLVTGFPTAALYHLDGTFTVLNSYIIQDTGTGLEMQISGLAMDHDRGHLWGILRNNPAGTVSRFVEFDVNVDPPVIIQGPLDVPWPGGPSSISSAGLEYNSQDCTLLALRQDVNNIGATSLVVFQDVDPDGAGGVTLLGECSIANTPCVGTGMATNRPWGIALIEGGTSYAIFSDLNLAADCATPEPPIDLHFITPPPFSGLCAVAVNPASWGQIKSLYSR
jgi:hypothetical protein